jgi:hypothetical protein
MYPLSLYPLSLCLPLSAIVDSSDVWNSVRSMSDGLLAQQQLSPGQVALIVVIFVVLLVLLVIFSVFLSYFRWWIQSFLTGAKVSFWDLVGMTFRHVKPGVIVPGKIMAVQAGLSDPELTTRALEAHFLAGGNVPLVIRALIAANKAKTIKLTFGPKCIGGRADQRLSPCD